VEVDGSRRSYDVLFIKSLSNLRDRPKRKLREIAIAGRSNVGKSSLINTLFNRRKLANVSSSPGKTRLINYYLVNNLYYLVDLPGYGFTRRSKDEQAQWKNMIEEYLSNNDRIIFVLLLIDARRGILEIDRIMINWLSHYTIPFIVIFTKTDKLSRAELFNKKAELSREIPTVEKTFFSAKSKSGREDILNLLHRKLMASLD
jgi:GTP-binding protein